MLGRPGFLPVWHCRAELGCSLARPQRHDSVEEEEEEEELRKALFFLPPPSLRQRENLHLEFGQHRFALCHTFVYKNGVSLLSGLALIPWLKLMQ